MGIFMGAQSMRHNSTASNDSTDLLLDSGSPCIGNSKEGLYLKIALIFMRHFYFKGIATKAYVADTGISYAESLLFAFSSLYNYQSHGIDCFLAL